MDHEEKTAFDVLLKCRELELNLHMARSNLCLVVEGALLAFVAPAILALKPDTSLEEKIVPLLLALSGVVVSAVCIPIVRGASFWVAYWEHRLAELESSVLPRVAIFRDHPSSRNQARLETLPRHLKYVSSRQAIMFLFWVLTAFWIALSVFVLFGVGWRPPAVFAV